MGDGPVLLLGGTGEARALAESLIAAGIPVISSLAGRVRDPRLPVGEVRIGGFGGVDGLAEWIRAHHVDVVVDATHPFATTMTAHAATVADRMGLPLLRVRRPAWTPGPGDRWETVPDMRAAGDEIAARASRRPGDLRVLLTTGRQDVGVFAGIGDATFLIRVVDPPTTDLPPRHRILRSRGPYDLSSERELMRTNEIDVLVTKNSGGELTRAKLVAAAELGVGVVMVDRPAEPPSGMAVDSVAAAMDWILEVASR
ncbi:cobalt-precorrin-6A reductase [Gordonia sp. SID5947]|uniref:cobalt-precorrin-6A reductase n=1 Tax=Gordonia sp. SID5947 TaxID=2690315 RepID=UPI00136FD2F5|nr:cobalt-precorrin-6A reductase [Gordonia sp. SID5947]MYR05602.1 cobalt-precorrin-6A reductase [Gordonia sp. SID5947]